MFIDRLYIKNYRCFGDATTILEFSKTGLTALIGPNNVGKSTVLKILDILLGDRWPTGRFTEDDFHNNELEKDIVLACTNCLIKNLSETGSLPHLKIYSK